MKLLSQHYVLKDSTLKLMIDTVWSMILSEGSYVIILSVRSFVVRLKNIYVPLLLGGEASGNGSEVSGSGGEASGSGSGGNDGSGNGSSNENSGRNMKRTRNMEDAFVSNLHE